MKAAVAVVLAVLGVAMFSASLWLQRNGLPTAAHPEEPGNRTLAGEPGPAPVENPAEQASVPGTELQEETGPEPAGKESGTWAVDHVLLK